MPVYNNEKYFPLAVNSILEQDYLDYELIIIDDGSTDRTPKLADEMAEKDERIRVIHQPNQWIYASYNRGIAEARGEYIYFLNSDDRLRAGSLGLMAETAIKYRPDIIWTVVLIHECDEEQNIITYNKSELDKRVMEEHFYKNEIEVRNNWPYFYMSFLAHNQANLYRSEIMKKHKFRNDVYGADTLYNISIASDIKSAYLLKEPVYDFFIYKKGKMNISTGKFFDYEHDMFNEIYSLYKNLFIKWKLPEDKYKKILVTKRMRQITEEIHSLSCNNCIMSIDEKLKYILYEIPDLVVMSCVEWDNREEELESRILSGIRELLIKEPILETNEMYFVYELLDALLCYEKDGEDFNKMEKAIHHHFNPLHIGGVFYNKLKGK